MLNITAYQIRNIDVKSYDAIKNWIQDNPLKAVAVGNIMGDCLVIASGLLHKNARDVAGLLGLAGNCYALFRSRKNISAHNAFNDVRWSQIARESASAVKDVTLSLLKAPVVIVRDVAPALRTITTKQLKEQFRKAATFDRDHVTETLYAVGSLCGGIYMQAGLTANPARWLETFSGATVLAGGAAIWLARNTALGSQFFMAATGAFIYSSVEPAARMALSGHGLAASLGALDPLTLAASLIWLASNKIISKIPMEEIKTDNIAAEPAL
jgi:hypothetical protein